MLTHQLTQVKTDQQELYEENYGDNGMLPMVIGRSISKLPGMSDNIAKPAEFYQAIKHQSKIINIKEISKSTFKAHKERSEMDQQIWIQKQSGTEVRLEAESVLNRLADIQQRLKDKAIENSKINLYEALDAFLKSKIKLRKINIKHAGIMKWYSHRNPELCQNVERFASDSTLGGLSFEPADPNAPKDETYNHGVTLINTNTGFCSGIIELPKVGLWSIVVPITRRHTTHSRTDNEHEHVDHSPVIQIAESVDSSADSKHVEGDAMDSTEFADKHEISDKKATEEDTIKMENPDSKDASNAEDGIDNTKGAEDSNINSGTVVEEIKETQAVEEEVEYITLGDSVSMKDLLTMYYTKFDQEKLKSIDKLLEKFANKEPELIEALEKKYGKLVKEKPKVKKPKPEKPQVEKKAKHEAPSKTESSSIKGPGGSVKKSKKVSKFAVEPVDPIKREADGSYSDDDGAVGHDETDFVTISLGTNMKDLKYIGTYFNTINPETGSVLYDVQYTFRGTMLS